MKTHVIRFSRDTFLNMTAPQDSGVVRTVQYPVRTGEIFSGVSIRAYVEDLVEKCDIATACGVEILSVEYGSFEFWED